MKKLMIPLALLVMTACGASHESKQVETVPSEEKETVKSDVLVKDTLEKEMVKVDGVTAATSRPNEVLFNGTLVVPPQFQSTVTLVMGGVVKNTSLLSGMQVKKGQVLATLENPEFIELQRAWLDSHVQLEFLESEYKRQQALAEGQAASRKKFQQSKADYLSMKSREQATAAQLALLGISSERLLTEGISPYLEIKAPISGYIGNVRVNSGKYIAAGETLCDVIDKSQTLLRLVAYEKDLGEIRAGEQVEFVVNGLGQQAFRATIIAVGQQVDETSRSLEVYARTDSSEPVFRPGMYVTARILKNKTE